MSETPDKPDQRMGALELAVYRRDWRSSRRYLRREAASPAPASSRGGRHALLREESALPPDAEAVTPGRVIARLLLARTFDRNPAIGSEFRDSSPIVIVDVPDPALFPRVAQQWVDTLGLGSWKIAKFPNLSDSTKREDYDAIAAVTKETIPAKEKSAMDSRAFAAVQLALPIMAISPSADDHLPAPFLEAATVRLSLAPIDASVIERTVRIVTGRRCDRRITDELGRDTTVADLLLSVRFDRTPSECVRRIGDLIAKRKSRKRSGVLRLDQLHGLDEAVAWARSTIADIEAWRRGDLEWEAIDTGVVLNGPSGTAKTTVARSFAAESGLPLFEVSYARWQGSGEGHLGHLLREMKNDMNAARAARPAAIVFCDELDSFPDRSRLTHSHKDYVVSVVNALLEAVSGTSDQRLVFVGASNDVTRCDPALIRAGRFNRVIQVGLPSPMDLEKIFRVYLDGLLADRSLVDIALLAAGSTGADVQRIVKDAKRVARQQNRLMTIDDLRDAMGMTEMKSPESLRRTAVHESGHIVLSVLHNGPDEVYAVIGGGPGISGMVASSGSNYVSGNAEECRRALQILLAGRAAEEIEYGDQGGGNGAGAVDISDLATATRLAAAMVGSYGLSGPHPLVYVANHLATDRLIEHRYMRMAVQKELSNALKEAKRLLLRHREALGAVRDRLLRDRRIGGLEVDRIIKRLAESGRRPDHEMEDMEQVRLP